MVDNIGIVDTKKIIATVQEAFGFDYSDYTYTILKRRLIHVINYLNIGTIEEFIEKIQNNNVDADEFIGELMVEATEMFRDPSFWRELREKYLPEISKSSGSRIWMPGITTGDELFSLMITLKELNFTNNIKVAASCPSKKRIEQIKEGGNFDLKKLEIGEANYARYSDKIPFTNYYQLAGMRAQMDTSLLNGVDFDEMDIIKENTSKSYRLVIYRNTLLQFNLPLYEKIIRKLIDSLVVGGYLIIGNMETLEYSDLSKKMQLVNESEKIYRKRVD
jgi:chemotaxis protein methyltransferase CheR